MSDAAEHLVHTVPRGRGELRIYRERYEGRPYTRLQLWYPTDDGELRPGRQCVTIRDHEMDDVLAVLGRVAVRIAEAGDARPAGRRPTHTERRQTVTTTGQTLTPEQLDEVF